MGSCGPALSTGGLFTVLCTWGHRLWWWPHTAGGRVASVWGKASSWLGWARAEGGKGRRGMRGPCVREGTVHVPGSISQDMWGPGKGPLHVEKASLVSPLCPGHGGDRAAAAPAGAAQGWQAPSLRGTARAARPGRPAGTWRRHRPLTAGTQAPSLSPPCTGLSVCSGHRRPEQDTQAGRRHKPTGVGGPGVWTPS